MNVLVRTLGIDAPSFTHCPLSRRAIVDNYLAAEMGIETLETRNRDCLDFHEVHIAALKRVIQRAFVLGVTALKKQLTNILNWIDA